MGHVLILSMSSNDRSALEATMAELCRSGGWRGKKGACEAVVVLAQA